MKRTDQVATSDEILDVAEEYFRRGGFHSASFRDIAARVNIKSASVHYHFPTKGDLGAAVMRRYHQKVLAFLGDPNDPGVSPTDLLKRDVALFRHSLKVEAKICLCHVLTSEASGLPPEVSAAAKEFAEAHIAWLTTVFLRLAPRSKEAARQRAWVVMFTLQGALAAAAAYGGTRLFDEATAGLERFWSQAD